MNIDNIDNIVCRIIIVYCLKYGERNYCIVYCLFFGKVLFLLGL